jgi:GT2 family glycosyltransferase
MTARCLRDIFAAKLPEDVRLAVYVVDDASDDGTVDVIRDEFPRVNLIEGQGNLFWGGAMRRAMACAMTDRHDFYLWLNDDVELFPTAIHDALATYDDLCRRGEQPIVCGATCDAQGVTTYSGMKLKGYNPLGFSRTEPQAGVATRCDTANGNFVLIPAAGAVAVGNIDPRFSHRIGDIDYMLRADRLGFSCWISPGYVGMCTRNQVGSAWQSSAYSLRERWKFLTSPVGLPPKQWLFFGYRQAGVLGFAAALLHFRLLLLPRATK